MVKGIIFWLWSSVTKAKESSRRRSLSFAWSIRYGGYDTIRYEECVKGVQERRLQLHIKNRYALFNESLLRMKIKCLVGRIFKRRTSTVLLSKNLNSSYVNACAGNGIVFSPPPPHLIFKDDFKTWATSVQWHQMLHTLPKLNNTYHVKAPGHQKSDHQVRWSA